MSRQATGTSSRRSPARKRPGRVALWRRPVLWAGAVAAVVLVVAVPVVFGGGGGGEGPGVGRVWDPAPAVAVLAFEGDIVRVAGSEGQGVVVNYWASWCFPCLAEMPGFERVYQRVGGEVAFLGVNIADDPASAEAVANDTGITYPVAVDPDGATFAAFGAFAMPTTVFISAEGEVLELYSGELRAEELAAKIEEFFGI